MESFIKDKEERRCVKMRIFVITLFLISIMILDFPMLSIDEGETVVYVDPQEILDLQPSASFDVSIKISNVANLYGFDIQLRWNPLLLGYVNHTTRIPVETHPDGVLHDPVVPVKDEVDSVAGTIWIVYASMLPAQVFEGDGTIVTITLNVKGRGECHLDIYGHDLSDKDAKPIFHYVQDGYFRNIEPGQIPVALFTYWPLVAVRNKQVIFNASESYDPDGNIANYTWNFGDGRVGTGKIVTHVYTTVGTFSARLFVADNDGIISTTISKTMHVVEKRDVSVAKVVFSPRIRQNDTSSIEATVRNNGGATETVTISGYYNVSETGWKLIDTKKLTGLLPAGEVVSTLSWNTIGVPLGNYTIKVNITEVPYDADKNNNFKIVGPIEVTQWVTTPWPTIIYVAVAVSAVVAAAIIAYLLKFRKPKPQPKPNSQHSV